MENVTLLVPNLSSVAVIHSMSLNKFSFNLLLLHTKSIPKYS